MKLVLSKLSINNHKNGISLRYWSLLRCKYRSVLDAGLGLDADVDLILKRRKYILSQVSALARV